MEIRTAQEATEEEDLKNLDIEQDFAHFSIKYLSINTKSLTLLAIANTIIEH